MPNKPAGTKGQPWYAGDHQDALFHLLIAIFFVELIVGGVAFFYGIIHASPEPGGGPPVAHFPWLAWALAAVCAPVALLLLVHLAGFWLSRALTREEETSGKSAAPDADQLPEGMRRFYASVRHAPTIVILVAILLLGAALFFAEGAFGTLMKFGTALLPHLPWIAGSAAALLAICFLIHALLVYRQRKMENEYAWRREVLEKTGLVLVDKQSVALPRDATQKALIAPEQPALGTNAPVLDVTDALPPAPNEKDDTGKDGD